MVVKITFTPLYGVHTDHHALAFVLSIDHFNILLDCGWTSAFDPKYLANLAKVAPSIHVVLLSHPDVAHVGALPYAVAKLGLKAPIFSTLPVWRMGQMFMYDTFLSLEAQYPFDVFNLDDVDAAFELSSQPEGHPEGHAEGETRYHLLKYQQLFPLDPFPKGNGIVITPHAAGHMLGGTVWNITKDTESIVYAVNFNHRRERHLNPTTLPSFSRPSHLIVGTSGALTHTAAKKTSELVSRIKSVLRSGGNVLIPVDTAGRVIEIAVLLHDVWSTDKDLGQVPLVILHDLSTRTFEFARSMIEWMSDEVVRKFDISRENLFIFKHIKLCHSLKSLEAFSSPMVVLASSASMEMGFARQLFARWCQDPRNGIILVNRPEPDTLYSRLFKHCEESADEKRTSPLSMKLLMRSKVYLQGQELEAWRESERIRIVQEQEEERKKLEQQRLEKEAEDAALSEISNPAQGGSTTGGMNQAEKLTEDSLAITKSVPDLQDPEAYDKHTYAQLQRIGVIFSKPQVPVFPFSETHRPSWDDYGQILDTTRFMIGEDPGEGAPNRNIQATEVNENKIEENQSAGEVIPTKYIQEELVYNVNCAIYYVDSSGQSDGDSMKRLVKEVEPRHVTLVAGTEEETAHLQQFLFSNLYSATNLRSSGKEKKSTDVSSVVVAPAELETVEITSHTFVRAVRLQDAMVAEMAWSQVGFSDIAFLDARVDADNNGEGQLILRNRKASALDYDDNMEIDHPQVASIETRSIDVQFAGHPTVFVGTIMLNRLKDVLSKAGMKAEFAGGALCVENAETGAVVLLKKTSAQQVVMEGSLSEEYFSVRDLLYEELVIPH